MAILSFFCLQVLLLAQGITAVHHIHHQKRHRSWPRSASCDFDTPVPAGWTPAMDSQWCAMISNEVLTLQTKEAATVVLPNVVALYKQAGIACPADSSLPDINSIVQDSQARAAMTQMKANYPLFGSMDLTAEDIKKVYSSSIQAACTKTGIPEDMMVEIIWTESKGHPLVYQGLTQMDYVAWGQMADANTNLTNRYMPSDNIVASAMYLADKKKQFGGDWESCYRAYYQG